MPPCRAAFVVAATAVLFVLLVAAAPRAGAQMTVVDPDIGWAAEHGGAAACTGTVEECVAASARRQLGRGGYIGYEAMSRGRVPCSIRGASYYNCRPGAPANPYSRGCSAITRCRG